MDNQKDTKNTNLNSYGHGANVSDNKALINNEIYSFTNKKTEKLVTALYMVTDCMDSDDALKVKLRSNGVELLSDIYKLANLTPMDKHTHISSSLSHIEEILSFINIASTIGYISEMNTAILRKEFMALIGELESHKSKDKHFTFTLDDKMFEIKKSPIINDEGGEKDDFENKDFSIGHTIKRTMLNNLSFRTNKTNLPTQIQSKRLVSNNNLINKGDRIIKIINLIKDKREVSIKDISTAFTDCSEKTIQRELNSLVSKGQLKKIGAKRWSRYQII